MTPTHCILACDGCGYSGSTFGNADWLKVGMACPNGCGGKVIVFMRASYSAAVEALQAIVAADPIDLALDPNWPQRIAAGALQTLWLLPSKRGQ